MLEAALKVLEGKFEKVQDSQVKDITDRVATLDSRLAKAAISFNGEFHPHLLTVTADRRWLLSRGLNLFLVKCLNSFEYLEGLRAVLRCAMLNGAQEAWPLVLIMAGQVKFLLISLLIGLLLKQIMIPPWLCFGALNFLCWIV